MKKTSAIVYLLFLFGSVLFSQEAGDYLGQKVPGLAPELFAPGVISTPNFEHSSLSVSGSGDEIFWSRMDQPLTRETLHKIMYVKRINGTWTEPAVAPFSGINSDDGPVFSPDGNRIYFYSRKPYPESSDPMPTHDIFYVDRTESGWSDPVKITSEINSQEVESSPSFTRQGEIVFARQVSQPQLKSSFWYSKNYGKAFSKPVPILSDTHNANYLNITPFISGDGAMLLFGSVNRPDGYGASDLYVCFKLDNGNWSRLINLGETINTDANERFPSLSADGKYLFFVSNRMGEGSTGGQESILNGLGNIYWVDANIIENLRPE